MKPATVVWCGIVAAGATAASGAAPIGEPILLDSGIRPEQVRQRPYRDYVRECVETLMESGTDRYGPKHTPVFVNILDVRDRTCPENPLPLDEDYRVTRRGRRGPAGANLYPDQPLMRTMRALSAMTGDRRYADCADTSVAWYLANLVDDKGFIWWGWHRHYDVYKDEKTGHLANPHEIHFQQADWALLWAIDEPAIRKEFAAIWQWHVVDKKTGELNRHGDGTHGCDFAFTGGELVHAFAFAYAKEHDEAYLDHARLVANYYWNKRDRKTNLIPSRPNAGADRFDGASFDTSTTGVMCPRLLLASERTGDPLFREQALAYLKAYAKLGWDDAAKSYWASLALDGTPAPKPWPPNDDYAKYQPRGHVDFWQPYVAGYACNPHTAQAYAMAAQMTGDAELLQAAKRWAGVLRAAWPPRSSDADAWYAPYAKSWAQHGTYAEYYGRCISFLLQMHAITKDDEYLAFARAIADEAVAKLYYKGLFRGHPCKPYYESIDGVGYLLYALLQLDEVDAPADARKTAALNW